MDTKFSGTTILNFLLGCGPHIQFAYSWPGAREGSNVWNGLNYLVREPPFGSAHLKDCDYTIDFGTMCSSHDRVAVIATTPLTDDEDWVEVKRGQLYCLMTAFRIWLQTIAIDQNLNSMVWIV